MSEVTVELPKKTPRPMLVSKTLLVAVTAEPPSYLDGGIVKPLTPYGPYTATIQPFNRAEITDYFAATRPFLDKAGEFVARDPSGADRSGEAAYDAKSLELLAPRIKSWDAELAEGVVAPINAGTVALLPGFAFRKFLDAALGAAGELLGN